MTTLTESSAPARGERPGATPVGIGGRLTFPRLVRAEWIKFTTLKSSWWALALVAFVSVGLSLLQAVALNSYAGEQGTEEGNATAVMVIVFSTVLTQLLAVILGTIAVTGEYSTGMIRSTLTAAPGRIAALLAKALVVATTMFVFSVLVFAFAGAVTGPMLSGGPVDFSDPETSLMPLLGAALYLAAMAAMGVGIGFIVRNGPGALAVGIVLVFVAPVLVMFFPGSPDFEWIHQLAGYLPSNAGQTLLMGSGMSGIPLETWPALITVLAWPIIALIGGVAVLKGRDA